MDSKDKEQNKKAPQQQVAELDRSLKAIASQLREPPQSKRHTSAAVKHLEKRMEELQEELKEPSSEKVLAYKIQRLAESKLLQQVQNNLRSNTQSKALNNKKEKGPAPRATPSRKVLAEEVQKEAPQGEVTNIRKPSSKPSPKYHSTTFQCKADLDACIADSKSAIEKALCFTLFIRCALKG